MLGTHLIQNPSGTFSFVGSVDGRLALATKDGRIPTEEQIKKAIHVGPAIAGLKTRTFKSREEALEFQNNLDK